MAETIQEWHVVDPDPETMSDEDNYEVEETILVIWDGEDPLAAMALVADTWPPLSQPEWQHDASELHSIPSEMIPIPSEHRELPFPPLSQPEWQHDASQLHSIPPEMIPISSEHRELPFPPLSQPEWQHDTSELHSIPPEMIPIPSEHRELPLQVDRFTAPAATARPTAVAKSATSSTLGGKAYAAAPPKLWKPWETASSDSGDNSTMNKGSGSSFTIDCDREEEVVQQTVVGQDFQQEYDLWLKSNSSLSLGVAGVDTRAEAEEPRNREVGEGPGNKLGSNLAGVVSDRSDMLLLDLSDLSGLLSRIGE
jgi:hypothetical protein